MRTSHLLKIVLILLLGLIIKMLISCVPHPPEEITYNSISVNGIDNKGEYSQAYTNLDTLYSNAVALALVLSDSSYLEYEHTLYQSIESLSYNSAMATSINVTYIPKNKVLDIKVSTIFDIDTDIKAGDDITDNILYEIDMNATSLYVSKNEAISSLNSLQQSQSSEVLMFLKKPLRNEKAQFKIDVLLDDEKHLSCITDTFTIIKM